MALEWYLLTTKYAANSEGERYKYYPWNSDESERDNVSGIGMKEDL